MKQKCKVILGIGSRLMEDDGIGVRVAEKLTVDPSMRDFTVGIGETDVDYCLGLLKEAEFYVVLDAADRGESPCTVRVQRLGEVLSEGHAVQSFHDFDLLQAMRREGMTLPGLLITVEAGSVSFGPELSIVMQEHFEEVVREIKQIILLCQVFE